MADMIAELIAEANQWLDLIRENMDAILDFSHNAVLPQQLHAVRARVTRSAEVIALILVHPAVSNSDSGGPASSGSGSSTARTDG